MTAIKKKNEAAKSRFHYIQLKPRDFENHKHFCSIHFLLPNIINLNIYCIFFASDFIAFFGFAVDVYGLMAC